ncbi:MAG: hypothetical protein Q9168_007372, partial [Polycauliona sp. 1 TL-2023]
MTQKISPSTNNAAETIVRPNEAHGSTQDASAAVPMEPLETLVEATAQKPDTPRSHSDPEPSQPQELNESSATDSFSQQAAGSLTDRSSERVAKLSERPSGSASNIHPAKDDLTGQDSSLPEIPETIRELACPVVVFPPDVTDSPRTTNDPSHARCNSSIYSTPGTRSRFHQTPETSPSPGSAYLLTPKDGNSYLPLVKEPFQPSTLIETPKRDIAAPAACPPTITITDASRTFESNVGDGSEGLNASFSLARVLEKSAESCGEEVAAAVENTTDEEHQSCEVAEDDDGSADDGASVKSQTPSAWERAMESQEASHQSEIEDLKDDHAAEVEQLQETITKLEKQAEAARKRKEYIEKAANKKVATLKEEKANEDVYYTGLLDAAESEMADKLSKKDEQLQDLTDQLLEKDVRIERQNKWAVTTAAWYSQLKHDFDNAKINTIPQLQQEVARLMSLNLHHHQQASQQNPQVAYFQDTPARVQNSEGHFLPNLLDTLKECDLYKIELEKTSNRLEQALGDLIKAQRDINHKGEQLKAYNDKYSDDPQMVEAAGLLVRTREAYQVLEVKASECLFREQKARKDHEQDKKSWKLDSERKQKTIDNLETKVVSIEKSNARFVEEVEQRLASANRQGEVDESLRFLYEESKKTVEELRDYVSQQENQITTRDEEIHQHKVAISLRIRMLEEKDTEMHDLHEENVRARIEIEEQQTQLHDKDLAADEAMQNAVENVDDVQSIVQTYRSQIQSMVQRGVPIALIEIHKAEIQEHKEHIAHLENQCRHYYTNERDREAKDWHDVVAANGFERGYAVLQMNWENANAEVEKLRDQLMALQQGGLHPQTFELAEQMDVLRDQQRTLKEKLTMSEEGRQDVVNDVVTLGDLSKKMWVALEATWKGEEDLTVTLGPVAEEIDEVLERYFEVEEVGDLREEEQDVQQEEQEVEEEYDLYGVSDNEAEPDLPDYVDEEEEEQEVEGALEPEPEHEPELEDYVDEEETALRFDGDTTAIPAQGGNAFNIPPSAFTGSWGFTGANPFNGTPSHDQQESESHTPTTPAHEPSRPGLTFTPPSPSSSSSPSLASYEDDELPAPQPNGELPAPNPAQDTDSYETIALSETKHGTFGPNYGDNHIDLEEEDSTLEESSPPVGLSEHQSLIVYNPIEQVDEELITQTAFAILFPDSPYAAQQEQ